MNTVYLNTGARSRLSPGVKAALGEWRLLEERLLWRPSLMRDFLANGVSALNETLDSNLASWQGIEELSNAVASIYSSNAQNIVLANSFAHLAVLAAGEVVSRGCTTVITTDLEHHTTALAIESAVRGRHVTLERVPLLAAIGMMPDDEVLESILERVGAPKGLIVVTHIDWRTGRVLPIRKLVKHMAQHWPEWTVLVDGAHAVGHLFLSHDVIGANVVYLGSGHKWLGGPLSSAHLVDGGGDIARAVGATLGGLLDPSGDRQSEGGTIAVAPLVGLRCALLEQQPRVDCIVTADLLYHHIEAQSPGLLVVGHSMPRSAIVSVWSSRRRATAVAKRLEHVGIVARGFDDLGVVRLCVDRDTRAEDIAEIAQRVMTALSP
jgi:cysteine sulfinate desulfinase/cysteine desulfurase-like protein